MKFGFWTPTFGGWLRNVNDDIDLTFENLKNIALTAERTGFDLTLVPELHLNDLRGERGPAFDAWAVATGLAAVTSTLEILVAARPSFHSPVALAAKQAATIHAIAEGRFSINIVSAWWAEEARQYGVEFKKHDARYEVTKEYVEALRGLWTETPFSYDGEHFKLDGTFLEPKPSSLPKIYAGGESEAGRNAIADFADAYLTHGGTLEELETKIADMRRRREEKGRDPFVHFGMAAFPIVRDTEAEALAELERITDVQSGPAYESYKDFVSKSQLDVEVSLRDYSVSNRGLRPEFIGTPEQVAEKILAYQAIGLDTLLLQFSPASDDLARFGEQVIPLVNAESPETGAALAAAAGVAQEVGA